MEIKEPRAMWRIARGAGISCPSFSAGLGSGYETSARGLCLADHSCPVLGFGLEFGVLMVYFCLHSGSYFHLLCIDIVNALKVSFAGFFSACYDLFAECWQGFKIAV